MCGGSVTSAGIEAATSWRRRKEKTSNENGESGGEKPIVYVCNIGGEAYQGISGEKATRMLLPLPLCVRQPAVRYCIAGAVSTYTLLYYVPPHALLAMATSLVREMTGVAAAMT